MEGPGADPGGFLKIEMIENKEKRLPTFCISNGRQSAKYQGL